MNSQQRRFFSAREKLVNRNLNVNSRGERKSAGSRDDLLQWAVAEMLRQFLLRCRLALHHSSLARDRPATRNLRITRGSIPAKNLATFQFPNFHLPYASMIILKAAKETLKRGASISVRRSYRQAYALTTEELRS